MVRTDKISSLAFLAATTLVGVLGAPLETGRGLEARTIKIPEWTPQSKTRPLNADVYEELAGEPGEIQAPAPMDLEGVEEAPMIVDYTRNLKTYRYQMVLAKPGYAMAREEDEESFAQIYTDNPTLELAVSRCIELAGSKGMSAANVGRIVDQIHGSILRCKVKTPKPSDLNLLSVPSPNLVESYLYQVQKKDGCCIM